MSHPYPCRHCGRAIHRNSSTRRIAAHKLPDPEKLPICEHGYPSVPDSDADWCPASKKTDEEYVRDV